MTPEERREMIVRTALPLVSEHGAAVTTGQISRAAGIGEATIFRVFADKDELLDACVAEAVRTDHVLGEIAAIPLDQPLNARLAEAAAAMDAYLARMGTVIGALHATGRRDRDRQASGRQASGRQASGRQDSGRQDSGRQDSGRQDSGRQDSGRQDSGRQGSGEAVGGGRGPRPVGTRGVPVDPGLDREAAMRQTRDALAELFEPERESLRLSADQLASIFLGMVFARSRPPGGSAAAIEDFIQVFLYGALTEREGK
jgi:AcrR family transcriptional regulator